MSGTQKRDLYLALQKHPEYVLSGSKFENVSAIDAEEIFAFFKGTRTEQPACLRKSIDVTMESVYQKRNQYLKQTFHKPMAKYQESEIASLLAAHGIERDVSTLTQFDAINIRNCYGPNPFSGQTISKEQQQYLAHKLTECNLSINRDIEYVLTFEYDKLLDYMDGLTKSMPGLLKTSPSIDLLSADKLQSFMNAKGITTTIPITAMCKADYDKLYGYAISQGQTPDCAIPIPTDRTEEFIQSIQVDGITEKKQLLLLQLRNQMNELKSLGIDPLQQETLLSEISDFRQTYKALETELTQLAAEYKNLLQLKQQLTYAESPSFLFGSLFDEKVHEKPEIIEKEEREPKPASTTHASDLNTCPDIFPAKLRYFSGCVARITTSSIVLRMVLAASRITETDLPVLEFPTIIAAE